jgi:hypothetical protein
MKTCIDCGREFPVKVKIDGKNRNLKNRKRCLDCHPFKGPRPQKKRKASSRVAPRECVICGRQVRRRRGFRCSVCYVQIRRYRVKWAAVQHLGGKCLRCGWEGSIEEMAAYEFHHPDANKENQIGGITNRSWDFIKKELEKCQLLCSKCHRIEHHGINETFVKAVLSYRGRNLDFETVR